MGHMLRHELEGLRTETTPPVEGGSRVLQKERSQKSQRLTGVHDGMPLSAYRGILSVEERELHAGPCFFSQTMKNNVGSFYINIYRYDHDIVCLFRVDVPDSAEFRLCFPTVCCHGVICQR